MLMPSEVSVRERASVLVKRFYAHARKFESATSHISSDYLSTIEHHFEDAVSLGLLPELADIPFGQKLDIAVGYQTEHYVRDFQDILFEVDTSPDSFDAKTYIPGEFNADFPFIPIFYDYAGPVFDPERMSCIAAGLEGVAVAIESKLDEVLEAYSRSVSLPGRGGSTSANTETKPLIGDEVPSKVDEVAPPLDAKIDERLVPYLEQFNSYWEDIEVKPWQRAALQYISTIKPKGKYRSKKTIVYAMHDRGILFEGENRKAPDGNKAENKKIFDDFYENVDMQILRIYRNPWRKQKLGKPLNTYDFIAAFTIWTRSKRQS